MAFTLLSETSLLRSGYLKKSLHQPQQGSTVDFLYGPTCARFYIVLIIIDSCDIVKVFCEVPSKQPHNIQKVCHKYPKLPTKYAMNLTL